MDTFILSYVSASGRLAAIKALRHILGIGLKESKNLMEGDGFIVSDLQKCAIMGSYIMDRLNRHETTADLVNSWAWRPYAACAYENMTANTPITRGEAAPFEPVGAVE